MKTKFTTQFKIARYEDRNSDGSRVWLQGVSGPMTRNGEEVKCQWKPDTGTARFALVDQWGFAHQWA